MSRIATVAILLACAVPAAADDILVLRDGTHLTGVIETSDDDRVTFRFVLEGAEVTVAYACDEIEPHCWYDIRAREAGTDAEAHLRLAVYCNRNGLFVLAERELRWALQLDQSWADAVQLELVKAREGAARSLLQLAQDAQAHGVRAEALRLVSRLLTAYPDATVVEEARTLARRIETQIAAEDEARRSGAPKAGGPIPRQLELAEALLDNAREWNFTGLESTSVSSALHAFEAAASRARQAIELAEFVRQPTHATDEVARRAGELLRRARREAIEAHLNAGAVHLVRGVYQQALQEANKALAVDPDDRHARDFRVRVEILGADGSRWPR